MHDAAHGVDLVLGRRAVRGLGAEDGGAHRRVTDEDTGVGVAALAPQLRQVLREGLEAPVDPGLERRDGHALDLGQVAGHLLAPIRRAGRDAEAAIAHDHRGDAERGRGRHLALPGDLGVVVGVHVNDAGREQEAVGIHRLPRAIGHVADFDDALIADGDIGLDQWVADAVSDHGAANHEIMHGPSRSFSR